MNILTAEENEIWKCARGYSDFRGLNREDADFFTPGDLSPEGIEEAMSKILASIKGRIFIAYGCHIEGPLLAQLATRAKAAGAISACAIESRLSLRTELELFSTKPQYD